MHNLTFVLIFCSLLFAKEWCAKHYSGATNCTEIRNLAQAEMAKFMSSYYYVNAAVTICFLVLVSPFSCCRLPEEENKTNTHDFAF
jgi:hypothetical protein